jgi:hypothetical protein
MGNGHPPGSTGLGHHQPIDHGTSARTRTPHPGSVGAGAAGATAHTRTAPSLGDQIVAFANSHRGSHVGDGECFALADSALSNAHAKSAKDFGTVTPDADYVWGTAVALADLKPGDIIQFRDYAFVKRVDTETADGGSRWQEWTGDRPHHTAVVQSVGASGAVMVLEQNAPEGSAVTRTELYFSSVTTTSGRTTTTITVSGTVKFYRPAAR